MPNRPYELPPISSLVSFEVAARLVSFKEAAKELNVTPAAVSHQVKALEADLDVSLFKRHQRGVELTETGAMLLISLQKGFETMSEAISQIRTRAETASVRIGATTAVSTLWLTPRLAQFWKTHGDISVSQIVSDTGKMPAECDLSVHYGDMSKESGVCHRLFRDRIVAHCSPAFASRYKVKNIADLETLPLVHLEAAETGWTDWHDWCAAIGYNGPLGSAHRVNNYVIALQAAQDDMGAVLGWEQLTNPIVASGQLVHLLPDAVISPLDFYVKLHGRATGRAKLVFDWLCKEAGE